MNQRVFFLFCGAAASLFACQDQQYVSPDTVALAIKNLETGAERVNACNYIPVLLGDRVANRYVIDGGFAVGIELTRDAVVVSYEGEFGLPPAWQVESSSFRAKQASVLAEDPPESYEVRLHSPCIVEE